MLISLLMLLFFGSIFLFSKFLFVGDDKYKNIIILMILFIFTFNPSLGNEQYLLNETNPVRINTITYAIFACLLFVVNKHTFTFSKETLFFLPLFISFILDLSLRVEDFYKYYSIVFTYISVLMLYLIIKSIKYLPVEKILKGVTVLALINAILSILQYITGLRLLLGSFNGSILYTEGAEAASRAVGLAGTNNSAGNFGAILFGVVLYNFIKRKSFFNVLVLCLTTIASVLTFTRIGYVSIAVQIIIFFLFSKAKKRSQTYFKIIFTCFFAPIAAFILFVFLDEIIQKLFTERGDTQSARFTQFNLAFDRVISNDFWFGVGTGQYRAFLYERFGILDIDLHSQYLNILAENGFIIFGLFVWFNIWLFIRALKNNPDRHLKLLVISIFVGNLICSNFNPNAHYYLINVLYFLLMSLLARGRKNEILKEQ
ncbi:O-antigen ligase family protein [Terribacillus aidingensis]|uniref:O-antigen ligase family protein n=1 Tax=Terribacillus aidingensis TaxID=586416 RepID=UPI00344DD2BD